MKIFHTKIRVKYADTDKMGVVYYGRHFEYVEAARNEMLREIDYPYLRLEQEGIMLPVLAAHLEYFKPLKYDDVVLIESVITSLENVRLTISYKLFRENSSNVAASGYTKHVFIGKDTRKPSRPPDAFSKKIRKYL